MKIAIPIFNFSKTGGIERHTYELVKRISKNHEVHVFSNILKNDDNLNIIWHKVPVFNFSILTHLLFVLINSIMLKKEKFDIVYNNGCGATFIQDVITSASVHLAWMKETKKEVLKKYFLNPMHYWTIFVESINYRNIKMENYKKVIAISNFIKRHLMNYYLIPEDKIVVIYHGVSPDEFNPQKREKYFSLIRSKYSISKDDTVLLFVGNEFKRKGLKYVFEAMKILNNKNLKLLVVGNGEIKFFRTFADSLGIGKNVVFAGFCEDVSIYYSVADIFIFPSTFDAFGLVVLEAMASGIPAIVSASTGASEIIEHGVDGFVVDDYRNSSEFARVITDLIKSKELMNRIGKLARSKAEKFTWDSVAEKTLEVFKNVSGIKQTI